MAVVFGAGVRIIAHVVSGSFAHAPVVFIAEASETPFVTAGVDGEVLAAVARVADVFGAVDVVVALVVVALVVVRLVDTAQRAIAT